MALYLDDGVIRTYNEQVDHLTKAHRKQLLENDSFQNSINELQQLQPKLNELTQRVNNLLENINNIQTDIDSLENSKADIDVVLEKDKLLQSTGQETNNTMSQKAITDAINSIEIPSQLEVVQEIGTSQTAVMSQKATTDNLALKANYFEVLNRESVVQEKGTFTDKVMSQKATSDAIDTVNRNLNVYKETNDKALNDNRLEVDRISGELTTTKNDIKKVEVTSNNADLQSKSNLEKINTINNTTIPAINKTITDNINRIDGDIGSLDATKADATDVISKTDIAQETGNSTTKVMSQDAVTKALASSGSDINVVQEIGDSQTAVMSQKATTDNFIDKKSIAEDTLDTSQLAKTRVLSQYAVSDALLKKTDKTNFNSLTTRVGKIETENATFRTDISNLKTTTEENSTNIIAVTNTATKNESAISNMSPILQELNESYNNSYITTDQKISEDYLIEVNNNNAETLVNTLDVGLVFLIITIKNNSILENNITLSVTGRGYNSQTIISYDLSDVTLFNHSTNTITLLIDNSNNDISNVSIVASGTQGLDMYLYTTSISLDLRK